MEEKRLEGELEELKSPQEIVKYQKNYSERGLWGKVTKVAKKAGIKVIYAALLLFYALKSEKTSAADRALIIGALGYFILPTDLIPDFIPATGYTDDLGALVLALARVASNITPEVKAQAQERLQRWFGNYDRTEINNIG